MNQLTTTAIILARTNYGEADRIITFLTPEHGKLRLMAKGVRRVRSKLAGGIELFSVSEITFIRGRGDIGTLISSRLQTHYGRIVKDINRTMLGYDLTKRLNKITEDGPEPEYFDLLKQTFAALDTPEIALPTVELWFFVQLLKLGGYAPNLQTDCTGEPLRLDGRYEFDFSAMCFRPEPDGLYGADHIKLLRLGFDGRGAGVLQRVAGVEKLLDDLAPIVRTLTNGRLSI